nr:MAG TPA: hypothetical protein [Caudoviricetes sp.]
MVYSFIEIYPLYCFLVKYGIIETIKYRSTAITHVIERFSQHGNR